ncbi:MAG: histidine kinase, partial [Oscillospiraceae bacterium]
MIRFINKLPTWYRNIKLRNKFLIVIVPLFCLLTITIMLLSFRVFKSYDIQLYQRTSQVLNMSVANIENELKQVEDIGGFLVTNTVIQKAFQLKLPNIRKKEITYGYNYAAKNVYAALKEAYSKNPYIISISICVDEQIFYVGEENDKKSQLMDKYGSVVMNKSDNGLVWAASGENDFRMMCIRQITEISDLTLKNLGNLVIEVDLSAIMRKNIETNQETTDTPMIKVTSASNPIYTNLENSIHDTMIPQKNGYHIITIDKKRYFATYVVDSYLHWNYYMYLPFEQVMGVVTGSRFLAILVTVFISIICVFICFIMVAHIVKHFDRLVLKMQRLKKGDFGIDKSFEYSNRKDEIGFIHCNFDSTVVEMEKLINDNYVKQILVQEANLRSLQQQINPHFLFNTLQTINWQARVNNQPQISLIAESLGKLLRYSLSVGDDLVSLETEIKIVNYYIAIQKSRYQDRLNVTIDIPISLFEQKIPKFALQSIIENAIKYALESILEPCFINIWTNEDDNSYFVFIEDNGPGIDEEIIEKCKVKSPVGDEPILGMGIGLNNIEKR